MDYYTVMLNVRELREVVVHLQICLLLLFRQIQLSPLKGVVETLRDLEELLASMQYSPAGIYADVIHQLHKRIEDFGNSTSLVCGVNVNNVFAIQPLGSGINLS